MGIEIRTIVDFIYIMMICQLYDIIYIKKKEFKFLSVISLVSCDNNDIIFIVKIFAY